MKLKFKIVLCVFLFNQSLYSQINLIGNSSFEDFQNNIPNYWSFRDNNSVAQILKNFPPVINGLNSGLFYQSIPSSCRTSAFFNGQAACDNKNINFTIKANVPVINVANTTSIRCGVSSSNISAHSGNHYLSLDNSSQIDKDGVDIDFGDGLETRTRYTLSFWYLCPLPNDYRLLDLRVYLSKSKLNSDIEIVNLRSNDLNDKTPGVWYKYEKQIEMEENQDGFHVLSFINLHCVSNNADDGEPFSLIMIDDVSLQTNCNTPCSPNVGKLEPKVLSTNNGISSNAPFCISGLFNASHIDLTIARKGTGQLVATYSLDNPPDKICFDLSSESSQWYVYRLHMINDCREKDFEGQFLKIDEFDRTKNNMAIYGANLPPFSSQNEISQNRCCQPLVEIKNQTFSSTQLFEAPQKLIFGPNITINSTADVHLKAGAEIVMIEPIIMQQGAKFIAEILPCSPDPVSIILPNNNDSSNSINPKGTVNKPIFISVYPNPASGIVNVLIENKNIVKYNITNIYGEIVKTVNVDLSIDPFKLDSFDISDLSSGVYIIQAINIDNITVTTKAFVK